MKYTTLGKSGLTVSVIGLGGIPVQRIDLAATKKLIDVLIVKGVNFIDSARGYTVSEEYLGKALAGRRDKFILASKSMARTAAEMAHDIDISLNNFCTDHIELYQLHNLGVGEIERAFADDGAVAAIQTAIRAGKVGHLGVTAHSPEALKRLLDYPEVETVMFPFNIVENQAVGTMQTAKERNIGFIAMKPLAGGNITNGRLAMRYILNNPNCTIAIPGMYCAEEVEQNTAAVDDLSPLTVEELAEIDAIRDKLSGNFCRRCGYCAPCTAGIDIPACFTMANYLENYELADWARSRYYAYQAHAEDCIGCGKCEERCPYQLPIREKLQQIKAIFGK